MVMITTAFVVLFLCLCLPSIFLLVSASNRPLKEKNPRACKRIGYYDEDNRKFWDIVLRKFSHRRWHPYQGKEGPIVGVVENLYVHPIKSCKAVKVKDAEVLHAGLKYDRQYMFAEYRGPLQQGSGPSRPETVGWHFVTQRKYGKLANIRVEIWAPDTESLEYAPGEPNVQSAGVLLVRYPDANRNSSSCEGFNSFQLPFQPTRGQIVNQGYSMEKVTVWKDCPESLLIASTNSMDAPSWLTDLQNYVGCTKPFALFRVAPGNDRQVFRNAPRKEQLGYQSVVSFADAYPLHILGLASIADIDRRLMHVVPQFSTTTALRFRANIYFKGPVAYAEDSWKRIRIGQQVFHVACRTTRCELPNTDQATGVKHLSEPSKTMRSYRDIDPGAGPGKACMGMQMVPAAEQGIISVGDEIEVLETGEHRYIMQ